MTMEWGTYKPNLYMAFKNRDATPINVGLLWYFNTSKETIEVRHHYYPNDYNVAYYEFHNGYSASIQVINDTETNTMMRVYFLKRIVEIEEGIYQSEWTARLKMAPIDPWLPMKAQPVFYVINEAKKDKDYEGFRTMTDKQTGFSLVSHNVTGGKEYFEMGSSSQAKQDVTAFDGFGREVWRVADIFKVYYDIITGVEYRDKVPNIVFVRPLLNITEVDSFDYFLLYHKRVKVDPSPTSKIVGLGVDYVVREFEKDLAEELEKYKEKFSKVFSLNEERF